ncbi:MAG: NUDIX hydrolase [Proteobacteria bacterium]|jgi:8-oxo-dGTP pyrophosphatase MutT (NUDIX family)|nr:NUDIX hydrolase [Pseudomonadota bacterium]MDA1300820.1 NUDIX hydrolase [Pseudomonadota bacterium]
MAISQPTVPVPAATILMLREGDDGIEVFMVVRHHQIDFATGALVFPGGKVEDGDVNARDYCDGIGEIDDLELGLQVGAIREAFEECGILLARDSDTGALVSGQRVAALEPYRDQLHGGTVSIDDFLRAENLRLACDLLQPFAHWVTPEMMPKRFDTRFYLAVAPKDHIAVHDGHESVDSVWITPAAALEGARQGQYTVIFPTRLNVEMLATSASVNDAIADARNRPIVCVTPWTESREDGRYICIPKEAGYNVSEELMADTR